MDSRSNLSDHNALCFVLSIDGKISCNDVQPDTDMQSGNISGYKRTYWDDQKKIVFNLQSGTAIEQLSTFEIPCEHDSGLCHDLDHRE